MTDIARVCIEARDLILHDGFHAGQDGWHGGIGWCLEGALAKVTGLTKAYGITADLSYAVNQSPVGQALRAKINDGWDPPIADVPLYIWNDYVATRDGSPVAVLQLLSEVAAAHTPQPVRVSEPVPVG
jgi:hypothetical protein